MNIDKLVRKVLLEVDETGKEVKNTVDINNPSSVLDLAMKNTSCFPAKPLGLGGLETTTKDLAASCGVTEGTPVVKGKNTGGAVLYLFGSKTKKTASGDGKTRFTDGKDVNGDPHFEMCVANGSEFIKVTDATSPTWTCPGVFTAVENLNTAQLSPEQKTQLQNYADTVGAVYSQFPPTGYSEQEFDKLDVTKINSIGESFKNFPPNTMFIWIRKGLMNATPDQVLEVTNYIAEMSPKLTTKIPSIKDDTYQYCITAKGLFPTAQKFPPGISYDNLKVRINDVNTGLKKGSWTMFCPEAGERTKIDKNASDMNQCREAIKFLYSCKYQKGKLVNRQKCQSFKTVFTNRYIAHRCNALGAYNKTVNILGLGIKKEYEDLLNDVDTQFGIGTFNENLMESVRISNTLDYTVNKFVLEAIKSKKSKSTDPIGYVVKKNLLEEFKRRRK